MLKSSACTCHLNFATFYYCRATITSSICLQDTSCLCGYLTVLIPVKEVFFQRNPVLMLKIKKGKIRYIFMNALRFSHRSCPRRKRFPSSLWRGSTLLSTMLTVAIHLGAVGEPLGYKRRAIRNLNWIVSGSRHIVSCNTYRLVSRITCVITSSFYAHVVYEEQLGPWSYPWNWIRSECIARRGALFLPSPL